MNASPSPFSAHSDVLDAVVPDDAAGKDRLLTELKNRGKAAVSAGHWPHAQALYEKALVCCLDDASNQKAILYSNISLVQGKMNHWAEAKKSASSAVGADPTYTKAWWRLGQAEASLENYEDAVKSLGEAAKLEPSNKALEKELSKQKNNVKKEAVEKAKREAAEAEAAEKNKEAAAATTTSTTTTKKTKVETNKSGSKPEPMQIDDDTSFSKSEPVRGYKIVNGKKTSYFHNELSEEAKRLIGDIAPKKLETTPPAPIAATENKGTSAWNKAGTWEERDCTNWATDSLKEQLEKVVYTLPASSPAPSGVVKTTKAKVSGHASVARVRGKKRFIYEMSVQLEWSFAHEGNEANGKISFPDIDGTCMVGEPYEASGFNIDHSDDGQLRPVLDTFVHYQGWRDQVHEAIDRWVALFKETY